MKDILLIFPPYEIKERYGGRKVGEVGGYLPPLGIAFLAAYLRNNGFSVDIIDAATLGLSQDELIDRIRRTSPKVIGISSLTPNYHRAVFIGEAIRREFPECLTVIGGHHATIESERTLLDNPCFDLLAFGEGEYTLLELMQRYRDSGYRRGEFLNDEKSLSFIKGIVFRVNNEIIKNERREFVSDMDSLPDPAWDLLPMERYLPLPNQYLRKPVVHMLVIRGCPFDCSFCSCNAVFGRKIRKTSPAKVIESIKHVMDTYGAKEISFWDDTITSSKSWITELCNRIIDEKLDITWTCLSRVDTVTKEMLQLMKKAGCWNIFFGFESANQQLLDNINKHTTPEQARKVIGWLKEVGIEVRASFMLALPGETPQMAEETIKFAIELEPDYVQFCITTPYPGTKLYEQASDYGRLHHDYSKYSLWHPVFVPHGYKDKDAVAKMEKYAMRKFYFRPAYIYNRLKKIRSKDDLLRYIKGLKMAIGMVR